MVATEPAAEGVAAPAAPARRFAGKPWFWWPWPLLVALDLWSKAWAFGFLADRYPRVAEPGRSHLVFDTAALRFELVAWGNTGTIWGLFQDGTLVLMAVRCVAVLGLFWFVRSTPPRARLQQFVLSLVLAGALGNLYDNFVRADRSVRDFLRFSGQWPVAWDFPAFNVADSCITVGAIGLFLLLWRDDRAAAAKRVS
ncbi:MAG: signal peptidase II [Planctomycetes bacterium]|nr:signal peptidase II [Planctomycetota bacterium]